MKTNHLMLQVQDLRDQLQVKENLLTLETEKRTTEECECNLKVEQREEVANLLKDQYHRRIISENELKWCKCSVDDLRQSSKASEAVRETQNLQRLSKSWIAEKATGREKTFLT